MIQTIAKAGEGRLVVVVVILAVVAGIVAGFVAEEITTDIVRGIAAQREMENPFTARIVGLEVVDKVHKGAVGADARELDNVLFRIEIQNGFGASGTELARGRPLNPQVAREMDAVEAEGYGPGLARDAQQLGVQEAAVENGGRVVPAAHNVSQRIGFAVGSRDIGIGPGRFESQLDKASLLQGQFPDSESELGGESGKRLKRESPVGCDLGFVENLEVMWEAHGG